MSENHRDPQRPIPPQEIRVALTELPDWRHRLFGIYTAYECRSSADAVRLLGQIGELAEQLDHHPDVDWRYRHIFVSSASHDTGGEVTLRDLRLARRISEAAAELGARAVPEQNLTYDMALDAPDPQRLETFWTTALGYARDERTGDLRDPHRRGPGFWFQATDTPDARPLHVDVTAPSSGIQGARQRLAPLAAGNGEDARFAPRWWIYTDDDGNRVCLCNGDTEDGDAEAEPGESG